MSAPRAGAALGRRGSERPRIPGSVICQRPAALSLLGLVEGDSHVYPGAIDKEGHQPMVGEYSRYGGSELLFDNTPSGDLARERTARS